MNCTAPAEQIPEWLEVIAVCALVLGIGTVLGAILFLIIMTAGARR